MDANSTLIYGANSTPNLCVGIIHIQLVIDIMIIIMIPLCFFYINVTNNVTKDQQYSAFKLIMNIHLSYLKSFTDEKLF